MATMRKVGVPVDGVHRYVRDASVFLDEYNKGYIFSDATPEISARMTETSPLLF